MIEVVSAGFLSIIVDSGRYGYAHLGVPPSSALDRFSYRILQYLLENPDNAPALEVMGNDLRLQFAEEMTFAITGARVAATLDDVPVAAWSALRAKKGSCLRVREVKEGLRYYIGFSGTMDVEPVLGSCTTNLECNFGGFHGRPFIKGDTILLRDLRMPGELRRVPGNMIPSMREPHVIRVIAGPEADRFVPRSIAFLENRGDAVLFNVTSRLNRTGIRLEGSPFVFREEVEKSIISEGILPGTVQVPPDGLPIINLAERTVGGYARLAVTADIDMDRLAHVKPGDRVFLRAIDIDEAQRLWWARRDALSFYCKKQ